MSEQQLPRSEVTCTCGASAFYFSDGSHTVGDVMRKTMYQQLRAATKNIWFCPICQVELRRVMRILLPMLGGSGCPNWSDLMEYAKADLATTLTVERA